ncbi:MAG TPA: hypothetical protein VGH23_10385 [Rhizomicrobium sp.]|jgi:hypothetical protein
MLEGTEEQIDANEPREFGISFLDAKGELIQFMSLSADTVTSATDRASEIATELSATSFFITAAPYSSTEAAAIASPNIAKRIGPLGRLWLGALSQLP